MNQQQRIRSCGKIVIHEISCHFDSIQLTVCCSMRISLGIATDCRDVMCKKRRKDLPHAADFMQIDCQFKQFRILPFHILQWDRYRMLSVTSSPTMQNQSTINNNLFIWQQSHMRSSYLSSGVGRKLSYSLLNSSVSSDHHTVNYAQLFNANSSELTKNACVAKHLLNY